MRVVKRLLRLWHVFVRRFKKEGIAVTMAQLCGDGSFINIKYILTRPDKVSGTSQVYLIDEQTCKRFYLMRLPRYGLIQTKHSKHQYSGIFLFRNSDGAIKPESRVTLVFGQLEVKNVLVV